MVDDWWSLEVRRGRVSSPRNVVMDSGGNGKCQAGGGEGTCEAGFIARDLGSRRRNIEKNLSSEGEFSCNFRAGGHN